MLCAILLPLCSLAHSATIQVSKQLTIGVPEAAPFASPNLANGGFYPELVQAIANKVGYDVKIIFLPFKRILRMLKAGSLSGAALVSYKAERTHFLIYPKNELYLDKIKIFGLKNGTTLEQFTNLSSLKGSTVGTFRGGFIESELLKHGIAYEPVSTVNQNIQKLLFGRVDYVLSPEIVFEYQLKQQFSLHDQQRIISYNPAYKVDKHYLTFSRAIPNAEEITDIFAHGLALIHADGTFDKIKEKYDFPD